MIVPLSGVQAAVAVPEVAEAPVGVRQGAEPGAGSGSSADTPAGLYFLLLLVATWFLRKISIGFRIYLKGQCHEKKESSYHMRCSNKRKQ